VVAAFDGYRAYAILGIVALHLLVKSGALPTVGTSWSAQLAQATLGQLIDVLFIISGFVVFLPTVARHGQFGSVRAYAVRRAARLVPAYWIVLVLALVTIALFDVRPPMNEPSLASVGLHAVFLQTPIAMVHPVAIGFGVDGPVWTLSLEVIFYALLPLVASSYARRPLRGLVVAAALTTLWLEAIIHFGDLVSVLGVHPSFATAFRLQTSALTQFPAFAFSFALGMTGAWAYVRLRALCRPASLQRQAGRAQVASLTSLAVFAYLIGHATRGAPLVLGAELGRRTPALALGFSGSLATLMVSTALGRPRWQWPFAHRVARRLGDMSYGIYLIHFVIITYALELLPIPKTSSVSSSLVEGDGSLRALGLLAVVTVPASLLYGYVSARWLEQPIRRWAGRYGRRMRETQGAQPTRPNPPAEG
jgi:peptidoglycan/LPS O-acetylase OafA/YrhL